jgi:hypothetical protein
MSLAWTIVFGSRNQGLDKLMHTLSNSDLSGALTLLPLSLLQVTPLNQNCISSKFCKTKIVALGLLSGLNCSVRPLKIAEPEPAFEI